MTENPRVETWLDNEYIYIFFDLWTFMYLYTYEQVTGILMTMVDNTKVMHTIFIYVESMDKKWLSLLHTTSIFRKCQQKKKITIKALYKLYDE